MQTEWQIDSDVDCVANRFAAQEANSEMFDQTKPKPEHAAELLGDVRTLTQQLGGTAGLADLRLSFFGTGETPSTVPALRQFFQRYCRDMLIGCELPAIYRAHVHASRFEVRELIEWDCRLGTEPILQPFAIASQQVGLAQLKRLRPLRDQRLVQRYLDAVEQGTAQGSHLVVYGLILHLYSLPLRQGLIGYGQQTLRGFLFSPGIPAKISETAREELCDELCQLLAPAVDALLRNGHNGLNGQCSEAKAD